MAKPTAPLFGFGASGQLGKSLVYASWKGLPVARRYVVPANPRTAPQQVQRGYMTAAVDAWHSPGADILFPDDVTAWNQQGSILGRMTGFNAFCKYAVKEQVAGGTYPGNFSDFTVTVNTGGALTVTIREDAGATTSVSWYFSTRVASQQFATSGAAIANVATFAQPSLDLPVGTNVYIWAELGTPGAGYARSGVYRVRIEA